MNELRLRRNNVFFLSFVWFSWVHWLLNGDGGSKPANKQRRRRQRWHTNRKINSCNWESVLQRVALVRITNLFIRCISLLRLHTLTIIIWTYGLVCNWHCAPLCVFNSVANSWTRAQPCACMMRPKWIKSLATMMWKNYNYLGDNGLGFECHYWRKSIECSACFSWMLKIHNHRFVQSQWINYLQL